MKTRTIVLATAILVFGLLSTGCKSTYMITHPHTLYPCAWEKEGNPQHRAFGALVVSLQDNRWDIVQGSTEHGFVRARACRHTYCVSVDAYVDRGGTIELFRSPRQRLGRNGGQLLESWMHKLTKRYEQHKCDPPSRHENLVEKLSMPTASIPPKPTEY